MVADSPYLKIPPPLNIHKGNLPDDFLIEKSFRESDLKEIKKDIAELKELLMPKPSIILTGQKVIDEYMELTKI